MFTHFLFLTPLIGDVCVGFCFSKVNWRAHKERLDLIESWIGHHRFPAQLRRRIWATR